MRDLTLLRKPIQLGLLLSATLAAASLWFYFDRILVSYQVADAAVHDRPRGNLSDLYPRWLGARELLLHGRNPYSQEITIDIQRGYYGRTLDASRPDDPKDRQGFAYPVYIVFLLAPLIGLPFHTVQVFFHWLLMGLMAVSVPLWLRVLNWRTSLIAMAAGTVLVLGSIPVVQGIKLQQLSLLVAAALAASAACIASGWLFAGGVILASATIKPQLVLPIAMWLLAWSLSDWKARRRLFVGFALTMAALLAGAEIVLPGWWRMFLEAIRQYHQYTQNESVLDQLVNWSAGRFAGGILAAAAAMLSGIVLWRSRKEPPGSPEFGRAVALVLALTVLIVPMYAPYNQVLLLPAILWLWRERATFASASPALRTVYALGAFTLFWPWIASISLTVTWVFSHDAALRGWKAPFYTTFGLPVVIFVLMLFSAQRAQDALRWRKAAE
jgi:Glycosyltransferase family 87